jgi:hypothetical protein
MMEKLFTFFARPIEWPIECSKRSWIGDWRLRIAHCFAAKELATTLSLAKTSK